MKKLTVLVDMDGVLENLSEEWVKVLNERYGTTASHSDVREWDIAAAFPTLTSEQVYEIPHEDAIYYRLRPQEGAPEYLRRIKDDGHDVYVVTSTTYDIMAVKMTEALFRYYPFLTWNDVIITANKQMIKGDVLIDDAQHNLEGGEYAKILFTAPYNEDYDAEANGMTRADNWREVYEAVTRLAQSQDE